VPRGETVSSGRSGGGPYSGSPCSSAADRWLTALAGCARAAAIAARSRSGGVVANWLWRTRLTRPERAARDSPLFDQPHSRAWPRLNTAEMGSSRMGAFHPDRR